MTPGVPSVQHSFSGVVVHHGVVAVLVCELYVGVPLFSCLGVVSKVDGSGLAAMAVNTVDHSTGHKSIAHRTHSLCAKNDMYTSVTCKSDSVHSLSPSALRLLFTTQTAVFVIATRKNNDNFPCKFIEEFTIANVAFLPCFHCLL